MSVPGTETVMDQNLLQVALMYYQVNLLCVVGLPTFPYHIEPFGSLLLQVHVRTRTDSTSQQLFLTSHLSSSIALHSL